MHKIKIIIIIIVMQEELKDHAKQKKQEWF
jgi:hypothetical protein